jgi:hypothetical protein
MKKTRWVVTDWRITDPDERLAAQQREFEQAEEMRELDRAIANDHRRRDEAMRR